ncbi:unnamed protein product [Bursaphelenchus xylophilus]|uniref:(pine wood nematode) hypothetical protein n=1 Tax=Bursaphelenchus xylophilus TaxID=6326 RepID=A0A811LT06_BURXY|nr:unnamed protein product [Bursaphelenchus xylophilus]CAG9120704.1 unnamed protein product [Bursaphelenchus xylophilus]
MRARSQLMDHKSSVRPNLNGHPLSFLLYFAAENGDMQLTRSFILSRRSVNAMRITMETLWVKSQYPGICLDIGLVDPTSMGKRGFSMPSGVSNWLVRTIFSWINSGSISLILREYTDSLEQLLDVAKPTIKRLRVETCSIRQDKQIARILRKSVDYLECHLDFLGLPELRGTRIGELTVTLGYYSQDQSLLCRNLQNISARTLYWQVPDYGRIESPIEATERLVFHSPKPFFNEHSHIFEKFPNLQSVSLIYLEEQKVFLGDFVFGLTKLFEERFLEKLREKNVTVHLKGTNIQDGVREDIPNIDITFCSAEMRARSQLMDHKSCVRPNLNGDPLSFLLCFAAENGHVELTRFFILSRRSVNAMRTTMDTLWVWSDYEGICHICLNRLDFLRPKNSGVSNCISLILEDYPDFLDKLLDNAKPTIKRLMPMTDSIWSQKQIARFLGKSIDYLECDPDFLGFPELRGVRIGELKVKLSTSSQTLFLCPNLHNVSAPTLNWEIVPYDTIDRPIEATTHLVFHDPRFFFENYIHVFEKFPNLQSVSLICSDERHYHQNDLLFCLRRMFEKEGFLEKWQEKNVKLDLKGTNITGGVRMPEFLARLNGHHRTQQVAMEHSESFIKSGHCDDFRITFQNANVEVDVLLKVLSSQSLNGRECYLSASQDYYE